MGKPVPNYMAGNLSRKMMPLDIVMDERICTGYEYAAFCNDFRRIVRRPESADAEFQRPGERINHQAIKRLSQMPGVLKDSSSRARALARESEHRD